MALKTYESLYNYTMLLAIIDEHFKNITNANVFLEAAYKFLNQESISLRYYTGEYTQKIIDGMNHLKKGDQFQMAQAQNVFNTILREIRVLEEQEKSTYLNQPKIKPISQRLQEQEAIEESYLLVDQDITEAMAEVAKAIPVAAPISIAEDNGAALGSTLTAHQTMNGKLLIPLNTNSHYILLIRDQTVNGVTITCWDPLSERHDAGNNQTLQSVSTQVEKIYSSSVQTNYEYAGEQQDPYTCGDRVCRKAMQEAGIDNALTQAPANSGKALRAAFINLIANKHLSSPVSSFSETKLATSSGAPSEMDKKIQVKQDEYLAIALQEIYKDHPSISSQEALRLAQESLLKQTTDQLNQKRQSLSQWTKQHFFKPVRLSVDTSQGDATRENTDDQQSSGFGAK